MKKQINNNCEDLEVLKQEYDKLIDELSDVKKISKKFSIAVISIFMALLFLPTVAWGILKVASAGNPQIMKTINFDTGENRKFADFPSEFNPKTIPSDIENWYNDNLPFRSVLYTGYKNVSDFIEMPYDEIIRPALIKMTSKKKTTVLIESEKDKAQSMASENNQSRFENSSVSSNGQTLNSTDIEQNENNIQGGNNTRPNTGSENASSIINTPNDVTEPSKPNEAFEPTEFIYPIYHNRRVMEGKDKWLFYTDEDNQLYYDGSNILSDKELKEYTNTLITLNEFCKKKGIKLQIALWPNKEQIYSEYVPTTTIVNEYKRVQRWTDYVSKNTDVKIIYPKNELLSAKTYNQLYYKYDTHWNDVGAYIGYGALMKSLGYKTPDIKDLKIGSSLSGYRIDLISIGGLNKKLYTNDIFYSVNYKPSIKASILPTEMATDKCSHSTANAENKCNFVLIGDSYRESMIQYIQKDFTDAFVINEKSVEHPTSLSAISNADVFVLSAVERYDYKLIENAQKIINALS